MLIPFLGCTHKHLSFPMVTHETAWVALEPAAGDAKPAAARPQPHVTCLNCGREFWYDWQKMRRLAERPPALYAPRRAA